MAVRTDGVGVSVIGVNLRRLRDKRGLTQGKLAALTNGVVRQEDISRTESGKTQNPGPVKLRSLAIALDVDILEFWEGAEPEAAATRVDLATFLASPEGAALAQDEVDALRRSKFSWSMEKTGWQFIVAAFRVSKILRGGVDK